MIRPDQQHGAQLPRYGGVSAPHVGAGLGLPAAIAELVHAVSAESRPQILSVMQRFADLGAHIDGVAHASVILISPKRVIWPTAAPGSLPHSLDTIQKDLGEGPALDAAFEHRTVQVTNLADDTRWPRFAPVALSATPVRSMLCVPLDIGRDHCGTLSLHRQRAHRFDGAAESAAAILAAHAAATLQWMQRGRRLRSGLGSRDIIGKAKGILMERFGIGGAAAFSLLSRLSQESHKPVVVIPKELIESHEATGKSRGAGNVKRGGVPVRLAGWS